MLISQSKLDFWMDNNLNVLFTGEYGVGKSSIILNSWQARGLKYQYFSGSTMDPWVDFVGTPEKCEKEGKSYIDYILPQYMDDDLEAIFIDEFNRTHKKIRNATMELIQFKSINGRKFKNLKMVWAAINPEVSDFDFDYDIEKLDPAQKDRFQIHYTLPYTLNREYFEKKFGAENAKAAQTWWTALPADVRANVSPRRVDYAIEIFMLGGDLKDSLPASSNPNTFQKMLTQRPPSVVLREMFTSNDVAGAQKFLADANNFRVCENIIAANKDYIQFFVPLLHNEYVSKMFASNAAVKSFFTKKKVFTGLDDKMKNIINDIIEAEGNKKVSVSTQFNIDIDKLKLNEKVPTSTASLFSDDESTNMSTFEEQIGWLEKRSCTKASEIHRVLDYITKLVPPNPSKAIITRCLNIVNIAFTNITAVDEKQVFDAKLPITNVIKGINTLIVAAVTKGYMSIEDIATTYPNTVKYFINDMSFAISK